jgi:long-chain fatty acid transport protein
MIKFLLYFLLCMPFTFLAQGYQVALQGQVQQGMASAGTAFLQDASYVFYNPGAGAFYNKSEVNVGGTPVFSRILFEDRNSHATNRSNSPMGTPFCAYGVYQQKETSKFKLGMGIYTPFGSTVSYEDGWIGRFALTRLELKAIFFQPTLSYKVNKYLGIGAGFVYAIGSVNLQKDIPVIDANGTYGKAELSGKAKGYGFNVGIFIQATEKCRVGLDYRSQVDMDIKLGTATFTVPSGLAANFPSGSFTSSLPLPKVISLGLAYKLSPKLEITSDVNFAGWKAYDTLAFDYEMNTTSLLDTKSARMYKNSFVMRLGAQYKLNKFLALRAGVAYGLTPVQNGYVTPETPDANRVTFTTGFGYAINTKLIFNMSLLYTHLKREDTNLETNLSGIFKTNVLAPGFSFAYTF